MTRADNSHHLPAGQRASDASMLTRLELAQERLRQITADNAALRAQLEQALGVIRADRQDFHPIAATG